MCLAIPMQVIELEGLEGKVEAGGVKYNVNFKLLPEVKKGDYVLVHAGFAIQKIDVEEAQETLKLIDELGNKFNGDKA